MSRRWTAGFLGAALALAGCAGGGGSGRSSTSTSTTASTTERPGSSPTATAPSTPTSSFSSRPATGTTSNTTPRPGASCTAAKVLRRMSLEQRVGQVFMVGTPATAARPAVLQQISRYHIGNAFLAGRSTGGKAAPTATTAALRARVTAASTSNTPLFIATDQEGGAVQVLEGPGFSPIPPALTQGSWSSTTLQRSATTWARQLATVGINLNLAPVADTVPSAEAARRNPPIGAFQREYGYSPTATAAGSSAFVRGMTAGGVGSTAKHFPGLGLVTGNTDTTSDVHDRTTTRTSAYLKPFTADIKAGATSVMMSSAIYDKIDPTAPAVFSPAVVKLVRSAGFTGPIMTDDVGASAQLARWSAGTRAIKAINAGVDLILTVDPTVLPAMYTAILRKSEASTGWSEKVAAAAYKVLLAKEHRGLLTHSCTG